MLPQADTTGPESRGLVFPEGDIADPQMSNEATDGLAPSVFAIFRAQLERILAFFRQRAKKTRGEQPRVRIRVVLPRPGGTLQAQFTPRLFDPSLEYSTKWCCSVSPHPISTVVPFVVCRGRRAIFLHGTVHDGRKDQAFPRPSSSGAHDFVA